MKKIISILLLLVSSVMIFSCGSKEEKKNFTICISASDKSAESDSMRQGLVTELKKLGLVEGSNVNYYYANAEGNADYAKQIVDEFKSKYNPDIFVTIGPIATRVTYENFKDKPIVFLGVPNADRQGYFDTSGNPVANITGVIDALLVEEHISHIAKDTNIKRLGVIYNAKDELAQYEIDYLKFNATAFNIDIKTVSIRNATDIDKALDAILPSVDAITLVHDILVDSLAKTVVEKASAAGKPVFGVNKSHKDAGADVPTLRDYILVGEDGAKLVKSILVDKKKVSELQAILESFRVN